MILLTGPGALAGAFLLVPKGIATLTIIWMVGKVTVAKSGFGLATWFKTGRFPDQVGSRRNYLRI